MSSRAIGSALRYLGRRAPGLAPVAACALGLLPSPPPLPPVQAIQQAVTTVVEAVLPTPGLAAPVRLSPPPVSGVLFSPTPLATSQPAHGAGAPPRANAGGGASTLPARPSTGAAPHGLPIPFTSIVVSSPLDAALIGALATLPLLFGIWLLTFGRTVTQARRAREAHFRLALAADLGLKPHELTGMSLKALFALREKAAFDELTGVLRRAAGISAAEREIGRARRAGASLAIAFVDVDGLKEANDRCGHQAGDRLLRELAAALKRGLRTQDIVFRYGGDEFVCVLPETDARAARAKLGSIQDAAARNGIRFCAGVAELRRPDDVVSLFARADADLYDFKANRGEIVELASSGRGKRRRSRRVTA